MAKEEKTHNIKFTILTIVKCEVQYWLSTLSVKYIQIIVKQILRTFSSCKSIPIKQLLFLTSTIPFYFLLYEFDYSLCLR